MILSNLWEVFPRFISLSVIANQFFRVVNEILIRRFIADRRSPQEVMEQFSRQRWELKTEDHPTVVNFPWFLISIFKSRSISINLHLRPIHFTDFLLGPTPPPQIVDSIWGRVEKSSTPSSSSAGGRVEKWLLLPWNQITIAQGSRSGDIWWKLIFVLINMHICFLPLMIFELISWLRWRIAT